MFLYTLEVSNFIFHSSWAIKDFNDKNKLWDLRSRHGGCLEVVLDTLISFARHKG